MMVAADADPNTGDFMRMTTTRIILSFLVAGAAATLSGCASSPTSPGPTAGPALSPKVLAPAKALQVFEIPVSGLT